MLTEMRLEQLLAAFSGLAIGVLGDLFLDRYLDLDDALTERSLETGLDAYQVVQVRASPGAAGTVINNLASLGVSRIVPFAVIGDDGEGYELRQALARLPGLEQANILVRADRRTPTYTKPLLHSAGQPPRELNRLDIKNRTPLGARDEAQLADLLAQSWPALDALIVVDQLQDNDGGVVTARIRTQLAALGEAEPSRLILADSRSRIDQFRAVWTKPNVTECRRAGAVGASAIEAARILAQRTARPVFCTAGEQGMYVVDPRTQPISDFHLPAFPVSGPIDPVGAGDSTSAALACALAAGATLAEAGTVGNLAASITIQQLGTTGTATPQQIRQRWRECQSLFGQR